jgi:hypothetical protein
MGLSSMCYVWHGYKLMCVAIACGYGMGMDYVCGYRVRLWDGYGLCVWISCAVLACTFSAVVGGAGDYPGLLEGDELRAAMDSGAAFAGWSEGEISFPPTFKYLWGSQQYAGEAGWRVTWTSCLPMKE